MAAIRISEQAPTHRCTRCILPDTYPLLTFDEDGVCNYCREHSEAPLHGIEKMRAYIERHRSRGGKYDCLFALSGGRDSTFALHYTVKRLGLKPLATTIDHGFLPDQTHRNIQSAVEILDVDHVFVRHNLVRKSLRPVLSAWLHRPSAAMVSVMCLGCRLGLRKGFLKIVRDTGLRLCIFGSGEPERSFAKLLLYCSARSHRGFQGAERSTGMDLLGKPHDLNRGLIRGIVAEMLKNPRYLIRPQIPWRMLMEYLYEWPMNKLAARFARPAGWAPLEICEYIPWNEEQIMSVIQNELGWKTPKHYASPWRSDCKINLIRNKFYLETLGFSKNDELISGMIRRGMLTRDEGLARAQHDNVIPDEYLAQLFAEIGLSYSQARQAFESEPPA